MRIEWTAREQTLVDASRRWAGYMGRAVVMVGFFLGGGILIEIGIESIRGDAGSWSMRTWLGFMSITLGYEIWGVFSERLVGLWRGKGVSEDEAKRKDAA